MAAFITSIGGQLGGAGDSADTPFMPGEVLVYIPAEVRTTLTREELWNIITNALGEDLIDPADPDTPRTNSPTVSTTRRKGTL